MKLNPDRYAKYSHYPSHLNNEVLRKTCFRSPLTGDQQVLEVGCGPGNFTREFLLPHCQPCKRLVATDIHPGMVDYAKDHFSHESIIYDVLDITTPNLSSLLERYGKFDRIFAFLTFHMVQDHRAAYGNIAKLLKDQGECLVLAFSSYDYADVWADVYSTPKWKGRIPDPRNAFNSSFDFNYTKSTSQVEAEARDALRGTGLQCVSCEVQDSSWKYDDLDSIVDMLITIVPFKATVPTEEWKDFRSLVAEIIKRKSCTGPGQPLTVKFRFYVVHALKSTYY